jgi:Pro-kumamolisin, activation domain/Bacterial Ig-like domain (group 3)
LENLSIEKDLVVIFTKSLRPGEAAVCKTDIVWKSLKLFVFGIVAVVASLPVQAQPAARIKAEINNSERATISGSHPPMARAANDAGRVPTETKLQSMSITFSRTAAQEADLQALITAQQDPSSANFHNWLSPEDFAARFGLSDEDIAKVQSWLESQGFTVEEVARSKNRITFSGTVGQVDAAFGTELHYYKANGETHFAPSADLSIPAVLSPVVQMVGNLSNVRPKPHVKVRPAFTSSQSGNHFMTAGDISVIYDIKPLYSGGYNGAGQSIAVVGQSAVELSDIQNFQSAAGLSAKAPTLVLVPGTGASTVFSGDESESDLDLEYTNGIAPGATIDFVYTGDSQTSNGVLDAIEYAIENRIAPVISNSYGMCETALTQAQYASFNASYAQAAAQGQTLISASGDSGSTDCYGDSGLSLAQQEALAVDFPASSQYFTAVGGTEFPAADVAAANTQYWSSAVGSDVVTSALSYIPEQAWNDDTSTSTVAQLSAGGGGASVFTARPSWQAGVPGIPSGSFRLVPDISLDASNTDAPYIYCTSDTSAWSTGQMASCNSGFRDSSSQDFTLAGGTSFGAPIFAGMVAIINQKQNSTGQGVINSALYGLAANSTAYASAFHDIGSGSSNGCTSGVNYGQVAVGTSTALWNCIAASAGSFATATGYDEATGLGSIDLNNLLTTLPATASAALTGTTITLSAATASPGSGASDNITITVVPASGTVQPTVQPTGTVSLVVDGKAVSLSLPSGSATTTYTFSSTTSGTHEIAATYSGDAVYAGSSNSITLTGVPTGSITLSAANASVPTNSSGNATITVTPAGGYNGTVTWSVSSNSTSLTNTACVSIPSAIVPATGPVTATMTIITNAAECNGAAVSAASGGKIKIVAIGSNSAANISPQSSSTLKIARAGISLIGLVFAGLLGYRSRKLHLFAGVFFLIAVGFAMSGCGGGSSSSSSSGSVSTPSGSYTLTITGTDTIASSITAQTNMNLTVK